MSVTEGNSRPGREISQPRDLAVEIRLRAEWDSESESGQILTSLLCALIPTEEGSNSLFNRSHSSANPKMLLV